MSSLLALHISILEKVRDASLAGVIQWEASEDSDVFIGRSGAHVFMIKYKYPAYNADEGSDRDYVEVHAFGRIHRFMVGTPGWYLALEVLAAGIPHYREHLASIAQWAEADAAALDKLLRPV